MRALGYAVAFGAAGTQFLCPLDDAAHLLVGHAAPAAAFAGGGAWLGSAFVRTTNRT